ncbi:hypothetical protein CYLTODRAFT_199408 [Cylindrobasidium torrendii FP15055 ss-10]|uniref:Uncharacterized protein n=1 Tax=Cylindrobasidium torrendii FP15055 ss-10 TaxID=1314674 RepID=A0A0D7AUC2_9AGAR|nr:hypothetical protein CYLTODRAFT_199408 [Cylindrobasidium torrendii FP15055 ss-10]
MPPKKSKRKATATRNAAASLPSVANSTTCSLIIPQDIPLYQAIEQKFDDEPPSALVYIGRVTFSTDLPTPKKFQAFEALMANPKVEHRWRLRHESRSNKQGPSNIVHLMVGNLALLPLEQQDADRIGPLLEMDHRVFDYDIQCVQTEPGRMGIAVDVCTSKVYLPFLGAHMRTLGLTLSHPVSTLIGSYCSQEGKYPSCYINPHDPPPGGEIAHTQNVLSLSKGENQTEELFVLKMLGREISEVPEFRTSLVIQIPAVPMSQWSFLLSTR